jgi:hypothetical protein
MEKQAVAISKSFIAQILSGQPFKVSLYGNTNCLSNFLVLFIDFVALNYYTLLKTGYSLVTAATMEDLLTQVTRVQTRRRSSNF